MNLEKCKITTFEEAEDYISHIPRFTTKNTMEDTKAFLHRLGDPDRRMRIIHVAGTNGKGSVCAYLSSILQAAGYATAVFTSPHLVDIRERFTICGEMISRQDFLRAFLLVYDNLDPEASYHPTFFEYLFFMAMVLFAQAGPDFCILETGLGGRLDATNAVDKKELTVITHISLDHVEILGDTVEKIAAEKAGIFKSPAPAVFWDTSRKTSEVFCTLAAKLGIMAYPVSKADYSFSNFKRKTIDFCVHTEYDRDIPLVLHTGARYQMENCTLAVRAIQVLNHIIESSRETLRVKPVTTKQIQAGVESCFWAGRMEEVLPDVYVDGAHNEDGVRAFLETVAADGCEGARTLLFGVVKDKDYGQMFGQIMSSGLFHEIVAAPMKTGRTVAGEELARLGEACTGCDYKVYGTVADAFRAIMKKRSDGERVYVAGSLYLAGEIKELVSE